jgi:hypothetical protein
MQTFLPYPDYEESAKCLDYRRLGKQRVECKQLLLALGVTVGAHVPKKSGWKNHPATKMWRGYEIELCRYAIVICWEWRNRGYKDELARQFIFAATVNAMSTESWIGKKPPWLGDDFLHSSHRSNLLRKDPDHYGQFGWEEPDNLPYVWPV